MATQPQNANPRNYTVSRILYDKEDFAVAWGRWHSDGTMRVAMRWSGATCSADFPTTRGRPMWFQLPEDLNLMIIKCLIGASGTNCEAIVQTLTELCSAPQSQGQTQC